MIEFSEKSRTIAREVATKLPDIQSILSDMTTMYEEDDIAGAVLLLVSWRRRVSRNFLFSGTKAELQNDPRGLKRSVMAWISTKGREEGLEAAANEWLDKTALDDLTEIA